MLSIFFFLIQNIHGIEYPTSLPDPNGDNKSDIQDWFLTFRSMYMSQYDINLMF